MQGGIKYEHNKQTNELITQPYATSVKRFSMMNAIFKAAAAPSFWGISESEAHTLALKAGVIIPASEWSNTFSMAKAWYFVSRARVRRTKNELVNLACALYLNEPLKKAFN